jgi:phospholipid-binding lipoprotein MlaA
MSLNRIRNALIGVSCTILTGCAAVGTEPNPVDPWEGSNRNVYAVNEAVDKAVFRPIAEVYAFLVPQPIRTCVHNVFVNMTEPWAGFNSLLQERGHDAINTMGRFILNTTFGVAGCIDLASISGQPRIPNDFGVTLGVWGVPSGPYVVLPFLGASTVRDGMADIANLYGNQIITIGLINDVPLRNTLWGLEIVSRREALLPASKMVDSTAIDPYSFIRDAYLQRRAAMIRGNLEQPEQALPVYEDFEDDDDASSTAPTEEKKP